MVPRLWSCLRWPIIFLDCMPPSLSWAVWLCGHGEDEQHSKPKYKTRTFGTLRCLSKLLLSESGLLLLRWFILLSLPTPQSGIASFIGKYILCMSTKNRMSFLGLKGECLRWNEWIRRLKIWEQCWVHYHKKTRLGEHRAYKLLYVWWAARGVSG